jgi:hypothetical protein
VWSDSLGDLSLFRDLGVGGNSGLGGGGGGGLGGLGGGGGGNISNSGKIGQRSCVASGQHQR